MTLVAVILSAVVPQISACPAPKTWRTTIPDAGLQPIANVIRFGRGQITWNHVPIDDRTMQQYLTATSKLNPQPRLIVDTKPMDCATLDRIIATVERAELDCGYGRCVATDVVDPLVPPAARPPSRPD